MDITITGRGLDIPDRFRDFVTEKAERITRLAERAIALEVRVIRRPEPRGQAAEDRVELSLINPGPLVRAEAGAVDKYAAFDVALDKLVHRIRQAKDRRKPHRSGHRLTSLHEATSNGRVADVTPASVAVLEQVATGEIPVVDEQAEAWSPVVIRRKLFPAERMTPEEAVDRMELVGHDFFLFLDSETGRSSVVYRRKGWDYGVIALEDED